MTDPLTVPVFAEGMALLAERWNREISPGLSRIYATALRDLGAELFVAGVERAIAEKTFFPSAAEIRELARPRVSAASRAGEVLAAALATGWHTPHGRQYSLEEIERVAGEAARRAVVAVGGVRRLSTLTDDAFPFVLRDFASAFAEYDAELSARVGVDRQLAAGRSQPVAMPAGMRATARIASGAPSPVADLIAAAIPAGILPTLTETE